MKVLYNWLKEFVDVKAPAADLRARLSLAGVAIDSLEESAAGPVLDAEITANRPDCLGHYGIAREVAAIYRLPVKPLAAEAQRIRRKSRGRDARRNRIARSLRPLHGAHPARRKSAAFARLAAAAPRSHRPEFDQQRGGRHELRDVRAGPADARIRSRQAGEHRIVVRRARPGEKIRTLDGAERTLAKDMCVIADASRAVAIAGVMGGAESEIGFSSRNILLESAWFDPISIRRTSKALGLRTEASYRFERGADPEMAELASRRAAELIQQLARRRNSRGRRGRLSRPRAAAKIELARKELLRVMGADVPDRDIEEILERARISSRARGRESRQRRLA